MKFMKKGQKGFSLVELMIVVGIIGILAALALPRLTVFMAKSRQSEAKINLASIYTLQQVYYTENNTYSTNISLIGYNAPPNNKYTYSIPAAAQTTFNAEADAAQGQIGTGCGQDVWRMTETRALTNPTPGLGTCG